MHRLWLMMGNAIWSELIFANDFDILVLKDFAFWRSLLKNLEKIKPMDIKIVLI